ncbi:MAG: pyrroline-5-carboxylate reductase [Myxococcales bacterium]|nr:pyrroline-5-carboxylate reductase [Myxococcales bacterium]
MPEKQSKLAEHRIGFVGAGAMAEALVGGLLAAGVSASHIRVADPAAARRERLEEICGVVAHADNAALVAASDIVVIAVKPSLAAQVLADLAGEPDRARPLWISIAAGVRIETLAAALPEGARIVRAMPNTPALVRSAATAVCGNACATPEDLDAARALFESVGVCWLAPAEPLLDAVTGLSGSGPAYVFVFLEALVEAGVRVGLPEAAAQTLALHTLLGAARLAIEDGRPPAQLRHQVSSPGGTTIAGLERLEAGGLRAAVHEAVAAATQRSRELGETS